MDVCNLTATTVGLLLYGDGDIHCGDLAASSTYGVYSFRNFAIRRMILPQNNRNPTFIQEDAGEEQTMAPEFADSWNTRRTAVHTALSL